VEVKPDDFTELEKKKCRMLCRMSKQTVVMLDGAPEPWWYVSYHYFDGHAMEYSLILGAECTTSENRFFSGCGFAERSDADRVFTFEAEQALFASRSYFIC